MAGPWEKYQAADTSATGGAKPWERYQKSADGSVSPPKEPSTRTPFAVANDTMIELANSAVGGLGAAADFALPGNRFSRAADDFVKAGQEKQSDAVKADRAKFQKALDQSEGIGDDLSAVGNYLVDSPLQAAAQAAGSFALPGGAIKGARVGAELLGLGARGATVAGRAAGIGAGAALSGGDAAGGAYDLVMEMPERTLMASPQAQALADKGYLPKEIRETLAREAGRDASLLPALAGALTGAFGAEKVLAGGRMAQGGLRGALGTGAVEAATEAAEEGVTQFEGRRAAQKIDPSIDPTKNVAAMAAMGAAQGGPVGAVVGGMSHGHAAGDSVQDRYGKVAAERAAEGEEPAAPLALPSPGSQDALVVDAEGRAMGREDVAARNHPGRRGMEAAEAQEPAGPLALPAPAVTVGRDGTARTASQRTESAALDELERWARQELGYTDDVQAAGRRHPGRPEENPGPATRIPALPAPTVTVDSTGTARTAEQRSADLSRQREAGDLGLTQDVDAAARNHPGRPQAIQTPVDEAAHAAQTSPIDGAIEPTDGQKEAGNYRKGHVRVAGLDISIENPEGSERRGTDPGGKPWVNRMAGHYGYVRRTEGADGDQVDVFLKPGTAEDYSGPVFVVDQVDPKTGKFDEHKVMVGYGSQKEAETAYRRSYSRGWKGMGKVTPMDMPAFKEWLKGDTTQPAAGAIQPQAASGEEARVARAHSLLPEDRRTILRRSVAAGNITQSQADERALRWAANHGMSEGDTAPGRQVKRKWTDAEWARLGLLQSARDELKNAVDRGVLSQDQADALVEQARQTGDVAAADGLIMDAIDEADGKRPPERAALQAEPSGKAADLSRQNRDRSRPASIEQMNRIANAPDYDRLGFGRSPNEAAPMVSVAGDTARIPESDMGRADRVTLGDGTKIPVRYAVIEASDALASHAADGAENATYYAEPQPGQVRALNNGRMAGLQEAYRRKTAGAYTQAMIDDAQAHGVSVAAIRAKREPVLVRVYADAENRRPNMGALSNPQSNLGMSATEQAANDARVVPVDLLNLGDTASFDAASNRRFLDAFARTVQKQGEDAAQIRDGQGNYSRQFMDRARAAVFHRAYGDDALTAMASESADPDVRNILNALTMAAPDFAGMDAGPLDIRPQLAQAVHQIRDARSRGLSMDQHLAQQDMFGRDPLVDRMVGLLWGNIRAPRRVSEALRDMALFVQNEQARAGNQDMFGGAQVSADDIVNRGEALIRNRYGNEEASQAGLFGVERSESGRRAGANRRGGGQQGEDRGAPPADADGAATRVEEPHGTQDLFGQKFELEPDVSPASGGSRRAAPVRTEPGSGAIQFPSLRSRAAAVVVEPEGSQFAVRVEAKRTLDLKVPDGIISSPDAVASALASIRKHPQENLLMLLTDEAGMPISVLRHSLGQKFSTGVETDVIIGHAARVPKARNMWVVHNHPSGVSELSNADLRMSNKIAGLLRGARIQYRGMMAVGQNTFSNVDANGDITRGKVRPVSRPKQIPVVERTFVKRGTLDKAIDPVSVTQIAEKVSAGQDGVMLLDSQNRPVAFLPIRATEMGRLRGTGGLERLMAGVEKANTAAAVTVVRSAGDVDAAFNVGAALTAAGIRVLDIVADGKPLAQTGRRLTRSDGTFESRQPRPRAGVAVSDAQRFAGDFMDKLPGAGRLKVSVVQSVKDIPEGAKPSNMAEGVYYPASEGGRIYLVADNLPTIDRLHQVLAHEVVGHFGVEALLGERFDGVLADVRRLARVPQGERATGNEQPGDKNYATMEAVGMRYPDYGAKARAREVLARMAETNSRKYFLQGLYMKMRAALRAMGFDLKLTTADLRQMVVDAGRFLRRTPADQAYSGVKMAAASMAASESARPGQTDTEAFKRWFGDSRVVDSEGRPLVVYHGTADDITAFDTTKTKAADVIFTTSDPAAASTYAETQFRGAPNVMPLYVSIKRPAYIRAEDYSFEALQTAASRGDVDGILVVDDAGSIRIAAPLSPEQIKSAAGNRGTFDPSSDSIVESRRDDKPVDLPDAIIGRTLGDAGRHPDFPAAKAGNTNAAQRLVDDLVTSDVVSKVRDTLGDKRPTVVPVLAVESAGHNKIPLAAAHRLGAALGLDVDQNVYQSVKAKRTALSGLDRIFQQPEFDGTVEAGKEYLLVDDTLTQGGTMAALASHIRQHGGTVVGTFALTGKQYSATLRLSPETLKTLRERYGDIESEFRAATGRGLDALTESEGRYLAKHGTPDAVRARIVAEGHARGRGALQEGMGRQEGRLKQPQDDDQAPPDAGLFNGPVESRAAAAPPTGQPKQPAASGTARPGETLSKTERMLRDRTLGKIGAFTKPDSIQDRLAKLQDGWRAKAVQGVFDHFLSLKALSPTAYMQARLSKGTDGAAEYLVRHGAVKLTDGAIDGAGGKGLADILAGLSGEHDHFMAWIAGNRAERLLAEGREHLFTPDDVAMLKRLNLGKMADGRRRADVYAAALKDLNVLQKSVLDVAQDAGLINREARKLWEHNFYVPFYREMENDATGTMGPGQISGLVGQRAFKKLKGGKEKLGDLTANTVSNWSHLLSASMKNLAAQGAMESAVEMGIAEKIGAAQKDSVRIMVDGKERHYMVDDPMVLDSLTSLHYVGSNDPIMRAMRKMKHALTIGVTISPTFRVRNLLRDSLQAVSIDSEISLNPMRNMIDGWRATTSDSPTMRKLLAGGGAVRFGSFNDGQARNVKRLIDELQVSPDQVVSSPADLRRYARKAFDWYQELGDRSETVNRAAIYDAAIKNGKSHLEASYLARDLMDFTSHGSFAAVRLLTQVVPFMNARLQGMYKLGRAVRDNPARFAAVAGAVGLASALLYLSMKDDDDYKALPDWARNTYWVMKLPGTDKMIYIPKPFEIGALGTVVERATELAFGGDDYRLGDFGRTVAGVLGDQLAMNPIPQALKPAMEAAFNFDSFRGRNIDSMGQERLPPGERFTGQTSAGAVALGRAINVSPQRLEHMARGYFGWLGAQALNVADYLARPLSNLPENPRRDLGKIDNWFVVGDFVKDAASPSSKYAQRFYDMQNEVNQVYAAYNQARALGDVERAEELKRSDEAKLYGIAKAAGNQLTKINQAIKRVERSDLPAEEKRARLDQLYQAGWGMDGVYCRRPDARSYVYQ